MGPELSEFMLYLAHLAFAFALTVMLATASYTPTP